ncbi:MAG TPA: GNAT family N-acetyltransferase [Euzebyales bacterium]
MAATEAPIETTLRDGTRVRIRQVAPGDRAQFVEGFDKLSTRSRYLRFHSAIEELSDAQLDYLTQVDQSDHVAWVAMDLDDPDEPGIGVARFIRLNDEPHVAEAAVTVLDAYQGRGLGTVLLRVLAGAARARDIDVFRAYVLGDNRPMLSVLDRLGPTRRARQDGVHQIDVDLGPVPVGRTRSSAEKVFRAVTGKDLPAMRTTAPPVWMSEDDDTEDDGRRTLHEWLDHFLDRRGRAGDPRPSPRRTTSD